MDQELHDQIVSLKKQNANSVFELLKAQKRMLDLENKVKSLEAAIKVLIVDKEKRIHENNRLTVARLNEIKNNL